MGAARRRVTNEKKRADRELVKAQTTQSLFLADLARQQRTAGDASTAALLAIEALPDEAASMRALLAIEARPDEAAAYARPYVPEPELQLDGAWRKLRERLVLKGHES